MPVICDACTCMLPGNRLVLTYLSNRISVELERCSTFRDPFGTRGGNSESAEKRMEKLLSIIKVIIFIFLCELVTEDRRFVCSVEGLILMQLVQGKFQRIPQNCDIKYRSVDWPS